jgi:hypothetical protein
VAFDLLASDWRAMPRYDGLARDNGQKEGADHGTD